MELKEQSFSILVEEEMQGKLFVAIIHFTKWPYFADHKLLAESGDTKYAVLQSFDLICDSTEEQQLWCQAVSSIVYTLQLLIWW